MEEIVHALLGLQVGLTTAIALLLVVGLLLFKLLQAGSVLIAGPKYAQFLAIRYLLTRPINLVGMLGITVGVWALVVVVSLFSGVLSVLEGHLHAATGDCVATGVPPWAPWPKLDAALRDDANVAATAPRFLHYGLLVRPGHRPPPLPLPGRGALHGGDQPFLFVLGVDPAAEAEVTGFRQWLHDPAIPPELRAPDASNPLAPRDGLPTVLVGLQRMQREGLRVGDRVVWTTARLVPDSQGNATPEKLQVELVVGGAFKSAHGGFDGNNVFLALDTMRGQLAADDAQSVQEIVVRLHDAGDAALLATAERLQRALHRATERMDRGYGTVMTWREKNANFLASVEHQRGLLKIVLIVIMVIAAFLMLATLSMMVTEKTGDIGILTAMGGTPRGVTSVFLACGIVITLVGTGVGLATGCLTAVYLEEVRQAVRWATGVDLFPLDVYNLDRVPYSIEPLWLLQVTLAALAVGFLVSFLPARRASRQDPLVSLRGI
jgi:lipoprotein-releasing system permease protein